MISMITYLASSLLLVTGAFFLVAGGIGILRFPDFFTRLHAAGVSETLGTFCLLLGLLLLGGGWLVSVKLLLIMLFLWHTNPTSSHALAKAALHDGYQPKAAFEEDESSKTSS